jgi:hypothetical protein
MVAWKALSRLVHERMEGFEKRMALMTVGLLEKVKDRVLDEGSLEEETPRQQDDHAAPGRSPLLYTATNSPKFI